MQTNVMTIKNIVQDTTFMLQCLGNTHKNKKSQGPCPMDSIEMQTSHQQYAEEVREFENSTFNNRVGPSTDLDDQTYIIWMNTEQIQN